MADSTYAPKVYRKAGGDELVVASGGKLTIESGGIVNGFTFKGTLWFVDSTVSASGDGLSWAAAFKTIAEAVTAASAGDTICISGSFTEAVTCAKAGVKFIGVGTGPVQATWTAAADAKCLILSAQSCLVSNIKFSPPAYSAGVPAAIQLGNASYTVIQNCRFQGKTGSWNAIYSPVCNSDNVTIDGCEFIYMNTATYGAAILGVEAGGLSYSGWKITNNVFNSCVTAINLNGRVCTVVGNTLLEYGISAAGAIGAVMTLGIDLSGTSSGANAVWGNQLGGTYNATLYKVGASGDQWGGNFNVLTGGVTDANPS